MLITKIKKIVALITYLLQQKQTIPTKAFRYILNEISKDKIRQENIKAYEAGNKLTVK